MNGDIKPFDVKQWVTDYKLRRQARQRRSEQRTWARTMEAVRQANIALECPHKRTERVIVPDEDIGGLVIDGEVFSRCRRCGRVMEFIS